MSSAGGDDERRVDALEAEVRRLGRELSESERALVEGERRRQELEERWAETRRELDAMRGLLSGSVAYRVAGRLQRGARRVLPASTRRGRLLTGVVGVARRAIAPAGRERPGTGDAAADAHAGASGDFDAAYAAWLGRHHPGEAELGRMRRECEGWGWRPLVTVLAWVRGAPAGWREPAEAALRRQAYPRWELRAVDDGLAAAFAAAAGELVALVDAEVALQPHALWTAVRHLAAHPEELALHADEDRRAAEGRRCRPLLRGAWSPDLMLSGDHLGSLVVVRREAALLAGGLRDGLAGAHGHDLALRLSEVAAVGHVAEVLATRPDGGEAPPGGAERWEGTLRAVAAAVDRRGWAAEVSRAGYPGGCTVRYALRGDPAVTVIIPTRDRVDLLRRCIAAVESRTDHRSWRILVVDNDSNDPATLAYLASSPHAVLRAPGYFNYARLMNRAARETTGEHLLFLNNDVEVLAPGWMSAMLEHSQREPVGAVGARLLRRDGRPQHEGVLLGHGLLPRNLDTGGYDELGRSTRNVAAVTAAAMMMRRSVFEEVGGFDERLRVAYNDVDLALRVRGTGRLIVYEPRAELLHEESQSRGVLYPQADVERFRELWGPPEDLPDPFLSVHLRNLTPLELSD